jgi:Thrombospondin type 3 repeat
MRTGASNKVRVYYIRNSLTLLPILLLYFFILSAFCFINIAKADDGVPFLIKWDEPTKNEDSTCLKGESSACSNDLAGYKIYRAYADSKDQLGTPELHTVIQIPNIKYIDQTVIAGKHYRYFVTAVDTSGNESGRAQQLEGLGLVVTADDDNDGKINGQDNCPLHSNPNQEDSNQDGLGDACPDGHIPTGGGNGKCSPEKDLDNDGVCIELDNCPTTPNPDQADYNNDGIGDSCTRSASSSHIQCLQDPTNPISSIVVGNQSQVAIIDQTNNSANKYTISNGVLNLVGDISSLTNGPDGFGNLELVSSIPNTDTMSYQITSSTTVSEINFGAQKDTLIGCYVDSDINLDLVAINKTKILARSSSSGTENEISLSKLGKVKSFACGDTNADLLDELVVLHQSKASKEKRSQLMISIIDLRTAKVLKSYPADQNARKIVIADLKGNGNGSACTLSKHNKTQSAISCSKAGKRKILIPTANDITVGSFIANSNKQSFVTLGSGSKISLVKSNGKVSSLNADTMKATKEAEVSKIRKQKFINCR